MDSYPDEGMNPTSGLESDGRSDSGSDNDTKPANLNHSTHTNGITSASLASQHALGSHPSGSSCSSYLAAVAARNASLPKPDYAAQSYSIEAHITIPHSTQVNAFAAPPCFTHIYSGGADGFVRRHAMAMLNPDKPSSDNSSRTNLYSKPLGAAEGRQAILSGYWENDEPGAWVADTLANAGPEGSDSRGEHSVLASASDSTCIQPTISN